MKNIWIIGKREFISFFNSPIAYAFIVVFASLTNGLYMWKFFAIKVAEMRDFFELLPWTFLVVAPAISMRLWAEERRSGTLELLLTMPVKTGEVVLGKFAAAVGLLTLALVSTIAVPVSLGLLSTPDWGPIIGGYIGAWFMGVSYLAIGACASSLCKDQIVAFILALGVCFLLVILGSAQGSYAIMMFVEALSSTPATGEFITNAVATISPLTHYENFSQGLFDTRDVVFFLSFSAFFLTSNLALVRMKRH